MKVLLAFALLLACTVFFGGRNTTVNVVELSNSYIAANEKCVKGNITVNVYNRLWENKDVYVYLTPECSNVSLDSRTFAIPPGGSVTITGHARNVTVAPVLLKAYWDGGSAAINLKIGCSN